MEITFFLTGILNCGGNQQPDGHSWVVICTTTNKNRPSGLQGFEQPSLRVTGSVDSFAEDFPAIRRLFEQPSTELQVVTTVATGFIGIMVVERTRVTFIEIVDRSSAVQWGHRDE